MSNIDLDELYQSIILDHNRRPRNFREMENASCTMEGRNPLCGDQLTVWLKLEDDVISDVSFQGSGCAISKASASMMTQALKGKSLAESEKLFEQFHGLVTGTNDELDGPKSLKAFSGVSRFPLRVKCASLAWHAMKAAIDEKPPEEPVSTE